VKTKKAKRRHHKTTKHKATTAAPAPAPVPKK
jgi:hypothetical protein